MRFTPLVVAASLLAAGSAIAGPCDLEIESNDAMKFNKDSLAVPASCKKVTLKLVHTGKMPKVAMGHNWVLVKTADMQAVATDGIPAGADKGYLKPGDARVLAATKLIGGGESDTISFDTTKLKAGEAYSFFCSFPGHVGLMKGTFALTK
ncbi:azurin [Pseudorhodoferax sp.]|uniref:azurin n=1 Tax=Pseudorhodoferax sp. TaxID=1993553 RepID=UPI002DD6AD99|nr:azurin [Pseudorhodoferax sp.]